MAEPDQDEDQQPHEEAEEAEEKEEGEKDDEEKEPGEAKAEGEEGSDKKKPEKVVEVLPDKKPWSGEALVLLEAAAEPVRVVFSDPSLPDWLSYLINDDFFYFKRSIGTVAKPPQDEDAKGDAAAAAATEVEPTEEAVEELHTAVPEEPSVPFEVSYKIALEASSEGPKVYAAKPYVPPPAQAAEDGDQPDGNVSQPADAPAKPQGEGEEEAEDEGAEAKLDASSSKNDSLPPVQEAPPVEEEEAAPPIIMDVVTLAAQFSPEALSFCLTLPDAKLSGLEQWCYATARSIASPLIANFCRATKSVPSKRFAFDFTWLFERMGERGANMAELTEMMLLLLSSNVVPSSPILPPFIRNPEIAQAFVQFLLHIPKSLLKAWMVAPASEEEETKSVPSPISSALGNVLLDLRRRAVRQSKGKKPLRLKSVSAQAPYLPKQSDCHGGVADTVCAPAIALRDYCPHSLVAYMSDVILLALGMAPALDGAESFKVLLERAIARSVERSNSAWGGLHLLYCSIHALNADCIATLIQLTPRSTFAQYGPVDIASFTSVLRPDFTHASEFATKFWSCILRRNDCEAVLSELGSKCPPLADALRQGGTHFDDLMRGLEGNPHMSFDEAASLLNNYSQANVLGTEVVACPQLLKVAVDAQNKAAIHWFIAHGVQAVSSSPTDRPVDIVEYCLKRSMVELVFFLCDIGADLKAPWDGGYTCPLEYVEAVWRTYPEGERLISELMSLWQAREHERHTDPVRRFGLVLGCGAVA